MKTKLLFAIFLIINYQLSIINCNAQPGSLDMSFNPGTGAGWGIITSAIQTDGKIIIGGSFTSYAGISRGHIARVNTDGTLDTSFNTATGTNGFLSTTAIQNNGKIMIGGDFLTFNGTARRYIARLNSDGTLDMSFNSGLDTNTIDILSMVIQNDGKIIIGGTFSNYYGTSRNNIARINSDGTLDSTFNPGTGANGLQVKTIAIQSDDKIMIGGDFTTYNGTNRNRIARLNTDGTLDLTFNPDSGANNVIYSIVIQNNGKIIIGGGFTTYNGTIRNHIARLNTDGTLDLSFNPGTGTDHRVWPTAIQSDGKIIIGGAFTTYNGTGRNYIACLNNDGSLDTTFNPGIGTDALVCTTTIQNDGKIIIGGSFTNYNGTSRNYIARINSDNNTGINELSPAIQQNSITIYPNPFSQFSDIQFTPPLSGAEVILKVYDITGREVAQQVNLSGLQTIRLDGSTLLTGVYFLQIKSGNQVHYQKLVKE